MSGYLNENTDKNTTLGEPIAEAKDVPKTSRVCYDSNKDNIMDIPEQEIHQRDHETK
jgi:hypothetical protein